MRLFDIVHSFRARISLILILTLVATSAVLYKLNQRAESNIVEEVDQQRRDLADAIDIAQQSLSSSQWLRDFLKRRRSQQKQESSVKRILVVNHQGTIEDSSNEEDIGKSFNSLGYGSYVQESKKNGNNHTSHSRLQTVNSMLKIYVFDVQTSTGPLDLIIVFSAENLPKLLHESSINRLLTTGSVLFLSVFISLLLILGFTRPVTTLVEAAKRIASGDFDVQLSTKRRDEIGKLIMVFNEMVVGLRERRELEERLHRAEQSAIVGRLASGIAHEVKNPLNYISLTIDYLRSKFAPSDEVLKDRFCEKIDGIKDEIKRLDRLIRNFLTYGRPLNLNPKLVSLREVLSSILALSADQAEQQLIKLSLDKETEIPPVEADIERLKSCFSNLVLNAQQAMPDGGELSISFLCRNGGVEVAIEDTGTGISPENIEKIFEPYFSTKETGTGLGLALVKRIIEGHGGEIRVESCLGKGTKFFVWLPVEAKIQERASAPSQIRQLESIPAL
ncbi:MAG: HAMP domain-containing protein [Blastocatellia bacterium]|nr:HAMP domain-containing protein [Blastocatellia bacterium]